MDKKNNLTENPEQKEEDSKTSQAQKKVKKSLFRALSDKLMSKDRALRLVKKDWKKFKTLPDEYKSDEDIVFEAFKQTTEVLKYADKSLTSDINFMLGAFNHMIENGEPAEIPAQIYYYATDDLRKDMRFIMKISDVDARIYAMTPNEIRTNKKFALKIVEKAAIQAAKNKFDPALEESKDVVKKELAKMLDFMFVIFENDEMFHSMLIKVCYGAMNNAMEEMKKNLEPFLEAIEEGDFRRVSELLSANIAYSLESMEELGRLFVERNELSLSSDSINNALDSMDRMALAINSVIFDEDPQKNMMMKKKLKVVFQFPIEEKIRLLFKDKDEEVVSPRLVRMPRLYEYVNPSIQNNKQFVLAIMKKNRQLMKHLSEIMLEDRDIVKEIYKYITNMYVFQSPKEWGEDQIHSLVEGNGLIENVSDYLKEDANFMDEIYKMISQTYNDREIRTNSKPFMKGLILENLMVARFMDDRLKKDKDFLADLESAVNEQRLQGGRNKISIEDYL